MKIKLMTQGACPALNNPLPRQKKTPVNSSHHHQRWFGKKQGHTGDGGLLGKNDYNRYVNGIKSESISCIERFPYDLKKWFR